MQLTNYIAFQVENYEEAIAFYRDILEWELIKYTPAESKFKAGNHYFFVEKKEEQPLHTFFELISDNYAADLQKLLDAGCEITQKLSAENAMLKDKFGFRFHLYQRGITLPDL